MKEKDINIKIQDVLLNIRAVAIIVRKEKILFQKRKPRILHLQEWLQCIFAGPIPTNP